MIKPLRLLRATLSNIWIPAAIIIANIIKPAPPNTGNGIETINAPNTGNNPLALEVHRLAQPRDDLPRQLRKSRQYFVRMKRMAW